jgi:hypothetical protein
VAAVTVLARAVAAALARSVSALAGEPIIP